MLALLLALFWISTSGGVAQVTPFNFDQTLRVDYFHTGGPKSGETFALDRALNDGPWPGSRQQPIDQTNLGPYRVEARDVASGGLLYSRGFASVYGEWETTAEARKIHRTFHESVRMPWPVRPVRIVIQKRQAASNEFAEVWSTEIDAGSRFVNSAAPVPRGKVWSLFENGPADRKVDLLLISEGYTEAELPKFHRDAERLVGALFAQEPFKSRRGDFNVRGLDLPSPRSGVNRPNAGVFRRTPLAAEYNIFDSERYVLTLDNRALRDAAASAPYEFIEILVNERTYGGGGIFNDQATASADSGFAEYVFVHEFGHHFAALADEYYTSDVAYETGAAPKKEPWEPNVTALLDPSSLKWRDLITPGTPLPTPWPKQEFELQAREFQARRREIRQRNAPEEEMDAHFRRQLEADERVLKSGPYASAVGAFEGASYEARGLYRPQVDCIMFTRDRVGFCAVCRRAIGTIIDLYSSR